MKAVAAHAGMSGSKSQSMSQKSGSQSSPQTGAQSPSAPATFAEILRTEPTGASMNVRLMEACPVSAATSNLPRIAFGVVECSLISLKTGLCIRYKAHDDTLDNQDTFKKRMALTLSW